MGARDHRRVFISFLGTSAYTPAKYYFGEEHRAQAPQAHYVQEAIFRGNLGKFWHSEGDMIYIFTTEQAYERNYAGRAAGTEVLEGQGLESSLKKLRQDGLGSPYFPIPIPDGNNETEIWQIFKQLFDCLEDNDEVYIDITNAFRYLPMLGVTLLQYAKVAKNIEVKAIYYGNYEAGKAAHQAAGLGAGDAIEVPILDMRSFIELQDWSAAVGHFNRSGVTDSLQEQVHKLSTSGQLNSDQNRALRQLSERLTYLTKSIVTCRGLDLCTELQMGDLHKALKEGQNALVHQLEPLIGLIERKTRHFQNENGIENAFRAVRWCVEHNLLQQGITILQEAIISFLLEQIGMPWRTAEYGQEYAWTKYHRELAASALAYMYKLQSPKPVPRWKWPNMPHGMMDGNERIAAIMEHPLTQEFCRSYSELTKLRNDINHAGFLTPKTSLEFEEVLHRCLEYVERTVFPPINPGPPIGSM